MASKVGGFYDTNGKPVPRPDGSVKPRLYYDANGDPIPKREPQFARNAADAMQCFSDLLSVVSPEYRTPVGLALHETPIYFVSASVALTIREASRTYPTSDFTDDLSHDRVGYGFLVFERPCLFVNAHPLSGLGWGMYGVTPFYWQPPRIDWESAPASDEQCLQFVGAHEAFIRQQLVAVTPTRVHHHVSDRIQKQTGRVDALCQVVTLRRRAAHEPSSSSLPREWHYQWFVRGHVRHLETGPIRVKAHIKGPDGKPMKAPSPRVFAVVR